ncbi:uncharacterized protein M421DRAFT_76492 [Didymella exigua CBS 183.55]|uniref:Uncharacterized protein n=1 Tax=Didymella exigua CBS 183.55 TaxID=1150837 RepID=A0A6A5R7T3_9PLEO|nr:uncharacterized protein M421DRAFT_76492 [Didymella exigua CBS 183.55]KAF1923024.1 hypothetical protein M421DRAFT_76492 [Didymella exigua CBS 183.55]
MINLTVFQKSTPHALRAISLASFIPAFPIFLIAGIGLQQLNPAIGLVPLFFSSLYSAILLSNEKKCGCQAGGLTGTPFHFILDFLIGTGLLTCLILAWALMGYYRESGVILGTLVHLYFVLCQLKEALDGAPVFPSSCPQCRSGTLSFSIGGFEFGKSCSFGTGAITGFKNGYTPLLNGDGEPRVYSDEHTNEGESMV